MRGSDSARPVVGVAFIHVFHGLEHLADRIWRGPEWLRPATILELAGKYQFILPLMVAVVIAAGISRLLSSDPSFPGPLTGPPRSRPTSTAATAMTHDTVTYAPHV